LLRGRLVAQPVVFGKFLMASTAFVTLDDIANYLPSFIPDCVSTDNWCAIIPHINRHGSFTA
jgi:hypothetical protein